MQNYVRTPILDLLITYPVSYRVLVESVRTLAMVYVRIRRNFFLSHYHRYV